MGKEITNVCQFKQVCIHCTKTQPDDRPHLCIAIQCEDYKVCPKCGMNRTLHETHDGQKLCKKCFGGYAKLGTRSSKAEIKDREESGVAMIHTASDNIHGVEIRQITVTPPGIPPPELNQDEKDYYNKRWNEYKGYYRNPKAYFICHQMILEELNLNYLAAKILCSRGEAESAFVRERQHSINTLRLLNEQLPDKEAEDVQDDEKSLAMIYDAYCREKQKRSVNGVSRILSQEAIALAPRLEFPIDPSELLKRCGFKIEEVSDVLSRIENIPLDKEPVDILEFFGFQIKEEYALPYEVQDASEYYDAEVNSEGSVE